MPINKETIISVFTEKLTLEQWLKTINKALDEAVLTGVEIAKKGNATLSFKFTFEDGTFLESNDLVLQQGESVNGAYIQNGHLYLTLTNGTNLDTGNIKPVSNFAINSSQHLIVNYQDGTNQDLGAIFQGNVIITGDFETTGTISTTNLLCTNQMTCNKFSADKVGATEIAGDSIIENMRGYAFEANTKTNLSISHIYSSVVKNGNKLTIVDFVSLTRLGTIQDNFAQLGFFTLPLSVANKLYPYTIGGNTGVLDYRRINAYKKSSASALEVSCYIQKASSVYLPITLTGLNSMDENEEYVIRIEATFLLSDNLAQ